MVDADRDEWRSKRTLTELRRINRGLQEDLLTAEARLDLLLALKDAPKTPHRIKPRPKKSKSQACPVLLASDWHIDERVDPETVNGRNKYNPDIARERATRFFQNGASASLRMMPWKTTRWAASLV